jgi:diguanylate cyclase (GGDEF)-like protein
MALFLTVAAVGLETARLFNLAVVDGLTGLYVRRYLDLRLNEEEARIRRYGGGVSIMMCDIDHFKKFNDAYGHARGDMVLKGVADILRESVRQDVDVVCRYGGEEFVVIMPNTSLHGAMVVAERICRRCREHPFPGPEAPLRVTLSGGSAHMDHDSLIPADLLLERADQALYRAKNAGRDQVLAWTSHNHQ